MPVLVDADGWPWWVTLTCMTTFIITALLGAAIVARATRLVAVDFIFEGFRNWVIKKAGVESGITYLVHCQWCLSIWFGAIVAGGVVWLAPAPDVNPPVQIVGLAAIFSFLTGVLGEHYGAASAEEGEA